MLKEVGVASSHDKKAPLLNRIALVEHLNLKNQDVKSRNMRDPQS
jgi:hypothetical protein